MTTETQKVMVPNILRKRLKAFRVLENTEYKYVLKNPFKGTSYWLEEWQFYILEVLPSCEDFELLEQEFTHRFGQTLQKSEFESLFYELSENQLLGMKAASHPLLSRYIRDKQFKVYDQVLKQSNKSAEHYTQGIQHNDVVEQDQFTSSSNVAATSSYQGDADKEQSDTYNKPEEENFSRQKGIKLFDPTAVLKILLPLSLPCKNLIYVLPILLSCALFLCYRYAQPMQQHITQIITKFNFFEHMVFSLVTVNLTVTLITALVATNYNIKVKSISLIFMLGFFPRLAVQLGNVKLIDRQHKLWLYASPLLVRLGLFSSGITLWYIARPMNGDMATFAMALSLVCLISFIFSANPLVKSSCYFYLTAFFNEPRLRAKSYQALLSKIYNRSYSESDKNILATYALISILFMLLVFVTAFSILNTWLGVYIGGLSYLIVAGLVIILVFRAIKKFKIINRAYHRSVQFERWRNRTLSSEFTQPLDDPIAVGKKQRYFNRALLCSLGVLFFIPYTYNPSGSFVIIPEKQQQITTDISGIIDSIYYEGGEYISAGKVIARLAQNDYLAQLSILSKRIQRQQAILDDLKAKPRPEEIQLAKQALQVAIIRENFSKINFERLEKIYDDGAVSFEDVEQAKKQYEVDIAQVDEKKANLSLVKAGASSDEIAAAEAELLRWIEEKKLVQDKIDRSVLVMPFDGKLVTTLLQQKKGLYLERGESFALAENSVQVIAEVELPEADVKYIQQGDPITVRPWAYSSEEFIGVVKSVDATVIERPFGRVVKVITIFENNDKKLKTGMTGYAKIAGESMPVWEVFSKALVRFFQIELWAWIS